MDIKAAIFEGRIKRKEFWIRVAVLLLAPIALTTILSIVAAPVVAMFFPEQAQSLPGIISLIGYWAGRLIFIIFPLIAIQRLHDLGRSGWWSLVHFIPVVGTIGMLIYCGFFPSKNKG